MRRKLGEFCVLDHNPESVFSGFIFITHLLQEHFQYIESCFYFKLYIISKIKQITSTPQLGEQRFLTAIISVLQLFHHPAPPLIFASLVAILLPSINSLGHLPSWLKVSWSPAFVFIPCTATIAAA